MCQKNIVTKSIHVYNARKIHMEHILLLMCELQVSCTELTLPKSVGQSEITRNGMLHSDSINALCVLDEESWLNHQNLLIENELK